MNRTIQVKMTIASHLSDAQELIERGLTKQANREINYAKAIHFKYSDTTTYVSEDELNNICQKVDDLLNT